MPITFVSGYLGAGKTTLINELLATSDRPVAVFVNDVGSVNIDASLIKRRHGDTIELTDGCVCCSLSEGFGAAFDQLRERPTPPDHLVVELSGVAEPNRVLPWAKSAGFRLDGVATLVDVEQFAENDRPDADPLVQHTMQSQLDAADLVVLTKTDLVEPDVEANARARITDRSPGVSIIKGDATTLALLLSLGARRSGAITDVPEPTLFDQHVTSLLPIPRPVDRVELKAMIDGLAHDVVRAKGIGVDEAGTQWLAEVVGRRRWVTELPQSESEPPSDLVVISLPSRRDP